MLWTFVLIIFPTDEVAFLMTQSRRGDSLLLTIWRQTNMLTKWHPFKITFFFFFSFLFVYPRNDQIQTNKCRNTASKTNKRIILIFLAWEFQLWNNGTDFSLFPWGMQDCGMMTQRAIMPLADYYCYLMCMKQPFYRWFSNVQGIRPVVMVNTKAPANCRGKLLR